MLEEVLKPLALKPNESTSLQIKSYHWQIVIKNFKKNCSAEKVPRECYMDILNTVD